MLPEPGWSTFSCTSAPIQRILNAHQATKLIAFPSFRFPPSFHNGFKNQLCTFIGKQLPNCERLAKIRKKNQIQGRRCWLNTHGLSGESMDALRRARTGEKGKRRKQSVNEWGGGCNNECFRSIHGFTMRAGERAYIFYTSREQFIRSILHTVTRAHAHRHTCHNKVPLKPNGLALAKRDRLK